MDPPVTPPPDEDVDPYYNWRTWEARLPTHPTTDPNYQWEQLNAHRGLPEGMWIPYESENFIHPDNIMRFTAWATGEYVVPEDARAQRVAFLGKYLNHTLVQHMPVLNADDTEGFCNYFVHDTMLVHWHVAYCLYRTCQRLSTVSHGYMRRLFRRIGNNGAMRFVVLCRVVCSMLEQMAEVWESQLAGVLLMMPAEQEDVLQPIQIIPPLDPNFILYGSVKLGARSATHMHNLIADSFNGVMIVNNAQHGARFMVPGPGNGGMLEPIDMI